MARELASLGERTRIDDGGVSWEGDARSIMRANLWLRTASRVLVRVAQFRATEFYELEKRAKKIEWGRFLSPEAGAEFRVTARKSKLYHSDAIAERLSAICSRLSAGGRAERRAPSAENREQLFVVRVVRDVVEISADTSGELLHVRGYRKAVAKAPLRETLAAALLLASDWAGETPLVDPFCGSGTIPIEAALIARHLAPGLARRFAFQDWPFFREREWVALVNDAKTRALASSPVPIRGSDRDAGAVEAAIANAERAGVSTDVSLSRGSISALEPINGPGLVATNPPYGKRTKGRGDVRNLFAQLGTVLRERFQGWGVAMYSPDPRLSGQTELPLEVRFQTSNGGIKVAALAGTVT